MAATYAQRRALGAYGERLAVRALESAGLEILDRNWRCARGEIDIVAGSSGLVVVCEVKTRRGDRYGTPVEAITTAKAERMYRLGSAWSQAHGRAGMRLRLDVVSVELSHRGPRIEHLVGVS